MHFSIQTTVTVLPFHGISYYGRCVTAEIYVGRYTYKKKIQLEKMEETLISVVF